MSASTCRTAVGTLLRRSGGSVGLSSSETCPCCLEDNQNEHEPNVKECQILTDPISTMTASFEFHGPSEEAQYQLRCQMQKSSLRNYLKELRRSTTGRNCNCSDNFLSDNLSEDEDICQLNLYQKR
jgi:hypothetical protein